MLQTSVVLPSGNHFPLTLLWEWELPLFIDPCSWAALIGRSDGLLIHTRPSWSPGWSFELGPKVSFRKETGQCVRGREGQPCGFSMTLACWQEQGLSSLPLSSPACLGPIFTQGAHKCPGDRSRAGWCHVHWVT